MAKEIINEDFEIPEHLKAEAEEQGFEIEVVDDTPEQDQGRRPVAAQDDGEHEEELENYSEKVQKRINQLKGINEWQTHFSGEQDKAQSQSISSASETSPQ